MKISRALDNPLRAFTTDKELVKIFLKSVVGSQHVVETAGIIRSSDELRAFIFPNDCCIKATHGSGWSFIRTNGEALPYDRFEMWLRSNYYRAERERNYKYLEPKIIVEPLVFNSSSVWDYKAFCYRGKIKLVTVIMDRGVNEKRAFFDPNWNRLDVEMAGSSAATKVEKPECFLLMTMLAEKIASFFDIIRVDFYTNGNQLFIGELTHCVGAANSKFENKEQETLKGRAIFGS